MTTNSDKVYCNNCKYKDRFGDVGWCKFGASRYAGRASILMDYGYRVRKNSNGECRDYDPVWWKPWLKRGCHQ
jgi:hypothetical protein